VTGRSFSPGTPVSSTNKTGCHDITEILLKVALNIITLILLSYRFSIIGFSIPVDNNRKFNLKIIYADIS
jgi:hypothetical protein